ncbi:ABC transporter permease family protein [Mycoplasmopsis cricetuli]|uniref:carbohydrate ABC transporter permease n=1 Tax=Mycoplasmopsis cricetuli TaxID=171283 RepID=UPI000472C481|nr:carbohydrate ABC transporter permease [Mycoplasmopsis cricetuli]
MFFTKIIKELAKYLIIIIIVLILLFPIYYLLLFSFLSKQEFIDKKFPVLYWVFNPTNYQEIFNSNLLKSLLLTFFAILTMIFLRIIIYSFISIVLINISEKLKKIILALILLTTVVPEFSLYIGLKTVIDLLDIKNANYFPLTLTTNTIFSYFLLVYLFKNIEKVKKEKNQVILNDNLSSYDKFRLVYFPRLKMSYFLIVVFSVINVWNDYLWPSFLMYGTKDQNITLWFKNLGQTPLGNTFLNVQAAGAVFSLMIPLSIYLIFSKFINKQISK